MTDENREIIQEQEQPVLEPTDTPPQDGEPSADEPVQMTMEAEPPAPAAVEQAESTPLDGEAGSAPEVAVWADTEQDAMPEESESVPENQTTTEPTAKPTRCDDTPEDAEASLTQGQRDTDQVIGMILGDSQEGETQSDHPDDDSEAQQPQEEAPADDTGLQETSNTDPQSETSEAQSEPTPTIESVLEAILFATDEPLTDGKLAGIVETTTKQVRESIEGLNARYAAGNHAFRVEQIAGGYQMLTRNSYNPWLKKMLRVRGDNKLSPAAMETLAIIAYKQPIIRADIEAIRGVAVGEVIRSLMYKGLVKIAGRAEILGHPMLYGTTKKFLEVFGLNSLKDLPKVEELKNPDRG